MKKMNIFDTTKEISELLNVFADAIRSAIDNMDSIPEDFESFFSTLEEQPVPKEKADAVKACISRVFGAEESADMDIATVDDIPGEFIGVLPYISIVLHHPRVVKSGINWNLKEIFESVG